MKKTGLLLFIVFFFMGCANQQKPQPTAQNGKKETSKGNEEPDPLPSWNNTLTKKRIIQYVKAVSEKESPHYIEPENRIAAFDNDGTMWCEKPAPFQVLFAFDKIRELAPKHPEWKNKQPYKAIIDRNMKALKRSGLQGLLEIMEASHLGISDDEFDRAVKKWLSTQKHPKFKKPYGQLIYQPMLELIDFLRSNGFKIFIVSGGGIDFMRAYIPAYYRVPSYQIMGSYGETTFENGEIKKWPEVVFINNEKNKPVAIYRNIGKRPVFACGNSDGDRDMLEYSYHTKTKTLQVLIHHTDAQREYAYDKDVGVFTLDKGLDEAKKKNWVVVDMKKDWNKIFIP
jgi:phosphoserine phosphatase